LQRFREYIVSTGVDIDTVPGFIPPPGGPVDFGLKHNSLGQTESFGPHTAAGPEAARVLPEEMRGSFGLPVPCVEHKIVDPDTNVELPEGVEGELKVRGYSISHGLYKRERHEAFDDDGWLHTGDKCFFKDGYLYFKGRISEMIKTSGSNVAPREVELTLETFPEVALAVVLGIPDERRGEAVGVVLVPKPRAEIDPEKIRARAIEELSNYKVPTRYLVLNDEDLPILGNGKPNKIVLREMLAQVPDHTSAPKG
jgi:acyl-CoA synthetase (AMP-forming)/AMP-acid ligase II